MYGSLPNVIFYGGDSNVKKGFLLLSVCWIYLCDNISINPLFYLLWLTYIVCINWYSWTVINLTSSNSYILMQINTGLRTD